MRILGCISESVEGNPAIALVAKLGVNLWANVNLLSVVPAENGNVSSPRPSDVEALLYARRAFLDQAGEDGPYQLPVLWEKPALAKPGQYEIKSVIEAGEKELRLKLRTGDPYREIINEAFEEEADLIVMSAPAAEPSVREIMRIAVEAPCSTMIIREAGTVGNMMVGVGNPRLSQTAREMLTQIGTIFHTPAAMYTLHSMGDGKDSVDAEMNKLLKLLKAHDLNAVTAEAISADETLQDLLGNNAGNILILR